MSDLTEYRNKLDEIDREIIKLFVARMRISEEIGTVKRVSGIPICDPEREAEVVSSRTSDTPDEYREGGERLARLLIEESKRIQRRGLNLYLIGMPDCGKTRTGKKLREILGLTLVDTDKLIMNRLGKTIDEIFDSSGEEGFRIVEESVLRAVAVKGGMTVALGGGTPLWGDNAKIIKSSGVTVFLDRRLEGLLDQNITNRPLLRGATREEINANIARQYHERHDKYAACADLVIDPDADGAAESIAEFYTEFIK